MHTVSVPLGQLAGTSEVAECLACPKQQLHALRKRDDFPPPVATLAATPLWDLREIRGFKDSWVRRKKDLTSA